MEKSIKSSSSGLNPPKKNCLLLSLLIVQMIFIFTMSSFGPDSSNAQSGGIVQVLSGILPNANQNDLVFLVRKTAHFSEYALLGILFYLYFSQKKFPRFYLSGPLLFSALASFLYACTDEFHQLFVPGRSGQLSDVIIDTLGATTGVLFISLIIQLKNKFLIKHG